MANHVRQQLRDSITSVVTGLTTTGTKVFKSRAYPLQESDLPCLVIKTEAERIDYLTINPPAQQEREVTVTIEATARATSSLDDTLDKICKEVEIAIDSASTIARDVQLAGTNLDTSVVGSQPVGMATMIYRMKVYTAADAPDTAL